MCPWCMQDGASNNLGDNVTWQCVKCGCVWVWESYIKGVKRCLVPGAEGAFNTVMKAKYIANEKAKAVFDSIMNLQEA